MKTKLVAPWNLRAGDSLLLETLPRDTVRDGAPRAHLITSILKRRSAFTGASVWECHLTGGGTIGHSVITYHGKGVRLPAEKALKIVEVAP